MSKNPSEDPDWQWLEDGLLSLAGAIWAFLALLITLFVNLACAIIGVDPTAEDSDDSRTSK